MKSHILQTVLFLIFFDLITLQAQSSCRPNPLDFKRVPSVPWERTDPDFRSPPVPRNYSPERTFYVDYINPLNAIVPDFQVNDAGGPNMAYQGFSSIASEGNGNFVVSWYDLRNGDGDIYAQRFTSDGTAIGTNFRVNDTQESSHQECPFVSANANGNFVIVWEDERNGNWDIYAQQYNTDGTALGTNFKVNDDVRQAEQKNPSVSLDNDGNFVITWMDWRIGVLASNVFYPGSNENSLGTDFNFISINGRDNQESHYISSDITPNFVNNRCDGANGRYYIDIYAQRYAADGTALGRNFRVNDDDGSANQRFPAISTDASGNFIITWEDERNGNGDIYAQRYASDGNILGTNFIVNKDEGTSDQYDPTISADSSGNFIIAWEDHRNGNFDIYSQRYSHDGSNLSVNFRVNDDQGSQGQHDPSVIADIYGNFVITWEDWRNGNADVFVQRYVYNGSTLGGNFKINDDQGFANQYSPSISMDNSGNFVISWEDQRNGDFDIYSQKYSADANKMGINFKINDDLGFSYQYSPSISVDSSGNFVITWEDRRNGYSEIYAQRYASDGNAMGKNFKVNDIIGNISEIFPCIASEDNGIFVIVWIDYRNGDGNIYGRRFAANGSTLSTNFLINDDSKSVYQESPSVAIDGNGNFVITWEDGRNRNADIYAQRYAFNGSALGTNFKVNDDQDYTYQFSPSISTDNSSNFVITWREWQSGSSRSDIYGRCFNSNGSATGIAFRVNDNSENVYQYSPSVAMDGRGNFVITWTDLRNEFTDIYAQRYAYDGIPLGTNFKVNDGFRNKYPFNSSISCDYNGNFVIIWKEWYIGGAGTDIYGQRYSSVGSPLGNNFRVTNTGLKEQEEPDVELFNGKIYNTWRDNRSDGNGYDIWANVLDWNDPVGINTKTSSPIPSAFNLVRNYPNPFNPLTHIEFDVKEICRVILRIYDIQGRLVSTLVDENMTPGSYTVDFNAAGQASGLYFYHIKIGTCMATGKMILIR